MDLAAIKKELNSVSDLTGLTFEENEGNVKASLGAQKWGAIEGALKSDDRVKNHLKWGRLQLEFDNTKGDLVVKGPGLVTQKDLDSYKASAEITAAIVQGELTLFNTLVGEKTKTIAYTTTFDSPLITTDQMEMYTSDAFSPRDLNLGITMKRTKLFESAMQQATKLREFAAKNGIELEKTEIGYIASKLDGKPGLTDRELAAALLGTDFAPDKNHFLPGKVISHFDNKATVNLGPPSPDLKHIDITQVPSGTKVSADDPRAVFAAAESVMRYKFVEERDALPPSNYFGAVSERDKGSKGK
ncbi:MAG: hypothetical protein K2X03_10980 [Bryobacteraceae bacterium]|nr:hypothetical protein [Bryobacteraceae bacterium]